MHDAKKVVVERGVNMVSTHPKIARMSPIFPY